MKQNLYIFFCIYHISNYFYFLMPMDVDDILFVYFHKILCLNILNINKVDKSYIDIQAFLQ